MWRYALVIILTIPFFLTETWAAKKRYRKKAKKMPIIVLDTTRKSLPELLKTFFDYYLPPRSFNGAILVAKEGSVLYERYTGWANKEGSKRINAHTAFHVASVSKTFTSVAILKLVQENKLRLEDKVVKYLPFLLYKDITVLDLLTHRSGLNTYDRFMRRLPIAKHIFLNNIQILQALNEHSNQKTTQANTRFHYSNSNYALLALIIEAVTKEPYKDFMEQEIFKRLNLQDTYVFSLQDTLRSTPSYDIHFRRYRYGFLDAVVGDKGIYTSTRDLLKWDASLMSGKFIRPELLDSAFQPYSLEMVGERNYGLGWRIDSVKKYDKKLVYHFGWWHGNRAVFLRDLTSMATAIVLSNKFDRNIYKVMDLFTRYNIL